ncbi:MAG: 4Fe-4S dicluster domain-containing protein [Solirubrobacterales bacterium]
MAKILTAPRMGRCISCYSCSFACAREVMHTFSPHYAAIRIKTRGGLQSKLTADICRACIDAPCAAACPYEALIPRPGGGVKLISDRCTGCESCIPACPVHYIILNPDSQKIIMCIHCGICARACPTAVLRLEESIDRCPADVPCEP